jgi:hypothetical protein
MPSSYQVVLWKQESFVVLHPLRIEFFRNLLEGITFFLGLTPKQLMEHMKLHKEDAFSQIRHFSGQGSAPCTRDGMNHLGLLVQRRIRSLSNGKDFDCQEVVREIAERIGPSLKEGVQNGEDTEDIFERVFTSALKAVGDQLDWTPILRQPDRAQFSANGELCHGIVTQEVHSGVQGSRRAAAGVGGLGRGSGTGL